MRNDYENRAVVFYCTRTVRQSIHHYVEFEYRYSSRSCTRVCRKSIGFSDTHLTCCRMLDAAASLPPSTVDARCILIRLSTIL